MVNLSQYRTGKKESRMNATKEAAHGRWLDILSAYISPEFLRNKHGKCPLCGGKDRFRYDDKKGNGDYFCSGCGAGSGIHLLSQHQGCSYSEAWKLVEKVLGNASVAPKKEAVDQIKRIKKILSTCRPVEKGDFVSEYLASRCLPDVPESFLRGFCWLDMAESPAMILKAAKGLKIVGVHVTFFNGCEKVARKMYTTESGAMVGSALRLHRLNGGDALVIGEGVETSLSAGIITGLPAWAAMDAGKLEKVEIPEQVRRVVIAADNDANFAGQAAAYSLAKRLISAGKSVEVIIPPRVGDDFNDILKSLQK